MSWPRPFALRFFANIFRANVDGFKIKNITLHGKAITNIRIISKLNYHGLRNYR